MARNSHAAGYVVVLLLLCTSAHAQDGLQGGTGVSGPPAPTGSATGDFQVWNAQQSGVWGICTPDGDFDITPGGSCTMTLDPTVFHDGTGCLGDDPGAEQCADGWGFGTTPVNMGNVQRLLFPDNATQSCDDDDDCALDYTCEGGTCEGDDDDDGEPCGEDSDCTDAGGTPNCLNAVCTPSRNTTAEGGTAMQVNTDYDRIEMGLAAGKVDSIYPGIPGYKIGGVELTKNFYFNGEGSCSGDPDSRDICRGGNCSGSAPNGVCTLVPNDDRARSFGYLTTTTQDTAMISHTMDVYDVVITGGWVLVSNTNLANSNLGGDLTIRATHDVILNDENASPLISMIGMGMKGQDNTGALSGSGVAGKNGGSTARAIYGALGASGANNGGHGAPALTTGTDCDAVLPRPPGPFDLLMGGGAAAVTASGGATAVPQAVLHPLTVWGGGGGGGAGCPAGSSGTPNDGPRGAGGIRIEAGHEFRGTNATITVAGTNGANGAAGSAAGVIVIHSPSIVESGMTYTVTGGTGSAFSTCGTSGNGGNGCVGKYAAPF